MTERIELTPGQCQRARAARDGRFDGRFFVAADLSPWGSYTTFQCWNAAL
jgi:hypothetical protein